MTGLFQLATAGEASSSVCKRDGEEEGGLIARGEQGFDGVAAEIVQGQSLRPLLADLAKLPGVGLLAVTQDDDARRRGERGLKEG